MNNVINFKERICEIPDDLFSLKELSKKLKVSYHYLYKYSVLAQKEGLEHITPYYIGSIKLSESETNNFIKKRMLKKWQA